jgi:S-adenosylmethionine:tRNA ribosyltransferase-isomerase
MALEFQLPPQLEANEPAELRGGGRDDVRLLVSHDTDVIETRFRELPDFLERGDLLVVNTSATLPAALTAVRENGEEIALHWSTSLPGGLSIVEPRKVEVREGERLTLPGGATATILTPHSKRLWIAKLDGASPIAPYLRRWGRPIRYPYVSTSFPLSAYQNVFARVEGSAEMPSAGRPFTKRMLACLRSRGVGLARLILHTGVASLESHEKPYEEWYEVPLRTAQRVNEAKRSGHRVIAVGTTVVRALESSTDSNGDVVGSKGWTELMITPERGVRVVDGLLTGLHEPRATHIAMLEAIAGSDAVAAAYDVALRHEYLWHEFGDMHLLWKTRR